MEQDRFGWESNQLININEVCVIFNFCTCACSLLDKNKLTANEVMSEGEGAMNGLLILTGQI